MWNEEEEENSHGQFKEIESWMDKEETKTSCFLPEQQAGLAYA